MRLHDLADAGAPNYFAYTGGLLMTHRSAGREVVAGMGRRLAPTRAAQPLRGAGRLPPSQADRTVLQGERGEVAVTGLVYACQHEKVRDLADLMRRRVSLGWDEGLGCDLAHAVARTVRDVMGWSAAEASEQPALAEQAHGDGRAVGDVGRQGDGVPAAAERRIGVAERLGHCSRP